MKKTIGSSKFDICHLTTNSTGYVLNLNLKMLGFAPSSVTPVSAKRAIVVDGHKSVGEWNESRAFGQVNATTYDPNGPFGDRFAICDEKYYDHCDDFDPCSDRDNVDRDRNHDDRMSVSYC